MHKSLCTHIWPSGQEDHISPKLLGFDALIEAVGRHLNKQCRLTAKLLFTLAKYDMAMCVCLANKTVGKPPPFLQCESTGRLPAGHQPINQVSLISLEAEGPETLTPPLPSQFDACRRHRRSSTGRLCWMWGSINSGCAKYLQMRRWDEFHCICEIAGPCW